METVAAEAVAAVRVEGSGTTAQGPAEEWMLAARMARRDCTGSTARLDVRTMKRLAAFVEFLAAEQPAVVAAAVFHYPVVQTGYSIALLVQFLSAQS